MFIIINLKLKTKSMILFKTKHPFNLFEAVLDDIVNDFSIKDVTKPIYDVIENDNEYIIEVQLPGIKKEDVEIKIDNEELSIKAERKKNEDVKYKCKKSYDGKQKLYFELLKDIDVENINASIVDGILTITLGKITDPEKLGKKTIEIK